MPIGTETIANSDCHLPMLTGTGNETDAYRDCCRCPVGLMLVSTGMDAEANLVQYPWGFRICQCLLGLRPMPTSADIYWYWDWRRCLLEPTPAYWGWCRCLLGLMLMPNWLNIPAARICQCLLGLGLMPTSTDICQCLLGLGLTPMRTGTDNTVYWGLCRCLLEVMLMPTDTDAEAN